MTLPNFLVIGAARSGTTSLYDHLRQHPRIFMSPVKEPRFFAYEGETPDFRGPGDAARMPKFTTLEAYEALFAGVSDETAIGEASVIYLYSPKAADRIRRRIPDAKLIAILRNPVDRAYSHFWAQVTVRGQEPLTDFAEALRAEPARVRDHWHPRWHYKQRGFYHAQLKRYFDTFDRGQIHVVLNEEFDSAPLRVMQDLYRFVGVDPTFEPDVSDRRHVVPTLPASGTPDASSPMPGPIRSVFASLRRPRRRQQADAPSATRPRPPLAPELRRVLIDEYRDDILRLQDLLRRDLSAWLSPGVPR